MIKEVIMLKVSVKNSLALIKRVKVPHKWDKKFKPGLRQVIEMPMVRLNILPLNDLFLFEAHLNLRGRRSSARPEL